MKIAAIGAGGVGGYFGARLQQAARDVAFLARGRHLAALKKDGLTLESPLGEARLRIKVFERPEEIGPVDVVMFAVKLWDTESAAESIRPILTGGGMVIPFQNGVESIDRLFTNSGSRCDISTNVRRRVWAEERKDGHLTGRRAARGG